MKWHIIDFHWRRETPYIVVKNSKIKDIEKIKLMNLKVNVKFLEKRLCPGTYSFKDWKYQDCDLKKDLTGLKYHRCKHCEDKIGFKQAFLFNGEVTNEELKKYLDQEHYLYLAYFPPDIIKVGTTSKLRKIDRLYEQDSKYFAYIASASGFDIQSIERFVSKGLGLTESVSLRQKLKYLDYKIDMEYAFDLISKTYDKVKDLLKGTEFEEWMFSKLEYGQLHDLHVDVVNFSNVEFIKQLDEVGGIVKTVKGRLIIFQNGENLIAIDGKKLIGEVVEEVGEKVILKSGKEQLGIF